MIWKSGKGFCSTFIRRHSANEPCLKQIKSLPKDWYVALCSQCGQIKIFAMASYIFPLCVHYSSRDCSHQSFSCSLSILPTWYFRNKDLWQSCQENYCLPSCNSDVFTCSQEILVTNLGLSTKSKDELYLNYSFYLLSVKMNWKGREVSHLESDGMIKLNTLTQMWKHKNTTERKLSASVRLK